MGRADRGAAQCKSRQLLELYMASSYTIKKVLHVRVEDPSGPPLLPAVVDTQRVSSTTVRRGEPDRLSTVRRPLAFIISALYFQRPMCL